VNSTTRDPLPATTVNPVTKLRVHFGISIDGYGAGPRQDLENPLGVRGTEIMEWFFPTDVFTSMHGVGEGEKGIDNTIALRGFDNCGAWILGRNMFGPVRGPWPDEDWKGWWGDDPPYHVPTFVLTHHARDPIEMKGGTTFHFVTDGIHSALERAREAAGGKDVRVGGGVSTVRQYLQAGLVDEINLSVRPVLLGEGEELFHGLDMRALGFQVTERVDGERAVHLTLRKL
jgi:dihydrofolate reductase